MKRVIIPTGFLSFALMLPTLAGSAQPAHVANSAQHRGGRHVLEMAIVWHRDHDADVLIFGSINNVQVGPDGGLGLAQYINGVVVSPQDDGVIRTQYLVRCREYRITVFEPDGTVAFTFGGSRTDEDQEVAVDDLMILAF